MTKILLITFMFLLTSVSQADTLYRWVDKDGKVHYGDRPAEDAVKAEKKRFTEPAAQDDEDLPYSLLKAKQDFPVTLFISPDCGTYCTQAGQLLDKRGIPYTEKNLQYKEDFAAAKKQYGVKMIPALKVGRTVLNGYLEGNWNNELDLAGYPKTAPFGVKPHKKAESKPVQQQNEEQQEGTAQPAETVTEPAQ